MDTQAQRRFVGLNVEEVSAVDSPANTVEFIAMKSKEGSNMENGTEEQNAAGVEAVQVTQETAGDSAEVAKALAAVAEIVKSAVEGAASEAPKAPEEPKTADVEKSMSFKTYGDMAKAFMKAGGMDAKMMAGAMEKMQKAGFDPNQNFPTAAPLQKGDANVKKASEDSKDSETPITVEALTKAARMTPARMRKLQEAAQTLKEVIEGIPQGESPDTKTPGGNSFGPSGIKGPLTQPSEKPVVKAEGEPSTADVLKAINTLSDNVKGLSTRVESIEKARPASSALPTDATDTNAAEVDTEKNFWSGAL